MGDVLYPDVVAWKPKVVRPIRPVKTPWPRKCPDCDGKGRWPFHLGGDSCDRCRGSGAVDA